MKPAPYIFIAILFVFGVLAAFYRYNRPPAAPLVIVKQLNAASNSFAYQSKPPRVYHELQNNLILGAAMDIHINVLHRFTRSARSSCNTCTIGLLVNNHTAQSEDIILLTRVFRVTLIIFETFLIDDSESALRATDIHTKRWIIFYHYLQNRVKMKQAFDNVLLCDVSDTIFQTNIFSHMDARGDGLYAFMEDAGVSIARQVVNADWIRICYGAEELQRIGNRSISCSGTVLGSWPAAVAYLSTMRAQFISRSRACLGYLGNDQGIHNYIVHNSIVPNTVVYRIPHETGFVGTVGLPSWLKRNKFGLVLNANKDIYAVVHQLNRSPQLLSQYDREYQMLPDSILDKKQ